MTHRCAAFLVALLWSAVPVLSVLHADGEAHRFCAEHGTIEESGSVSAPSAPEARSERASANANLGELGSTHDGCAFTQFCRFGQLLDQVIFDVAALPPTPVASVARPAPALPVALLTLAPKTSPPI